MKRKIKSVIENESTIENQTRVFVKAIKLIDFANPLSMVLYRHFNAEMQKAVRHGRICTPQRMAILYPIFREINAEQDEINAENDAFERRERKREAKKQAKKNKKEGAK